MKTFQLHINVGPGKGAVPVRIQARDAREAKMIAEQQYGKGSLANGGYVTEVR